jgi:TonB-dependent starch-binding outer membrane protein SusC
VQHTLVRGIAAALALLGGLTMAVPLAAQQQQPYLVRGRVVEAPSGRPIGGVQVALGATGARALTNDEGTFTLQAGVAPGRYRLELARIGLARLTREIQLGAERSVDLGTLEMRAVSVQLSEVVVTGTGAPTERRELGSTVTSVEGTEVNEAPAAQSVDKALQGKVVGAVISQNNGQPGGGVSIRLRGTGSILGGAEPLIVIDGVIVENNSEALVSLGANAGRGGAALTNSLADIAPGDIDHVEVVKGAAAAALYGSRANNGVIQIFTKRGGQGAPRVSYRTEFNTSEATRRFAMNTSPVAGRGDVLYGGASALGVPVTRYDYQDQIFQRGNGTTNQLSVSGGSAATTYYASALWQQQEGIVRSTALDNVNVRASLTQQLSPRLFFTLGGSYLQRQSDFVPEGEQTQGVLTSLIFTPTTYNPAYDANLGRYPYSPVIGTNPLDVIAHWKARDDVNRFIGSFTTNWTPLSNLTLTYLFGFDRGNEEFTYFQPARSTGAAFTGIIQNPTRSIQRYNNDITATYELGLPRAVRSTTTFGFRQTADRTDELRATASGLSPGQTTVGGGGATPTSGQTLVELRTVGGYVQERVGLGDRLFVTGGVNVDGSSAFGADERWQLFPRVGASWSVDREPYFQRSALGNALSTLRLRAAYGETGGQPPSAYSIFNSYAVGARAGLPALIPGARAGNPDLRPERQREIEGGADLAFAGGRVALELTGYHKRSHDLVLEVPLPLSSGYSTQFRNVGELSNRGIEVGLNTRPVDRGPVRWSSRVGYAANRSRVEKLVGASDTTIFGYLNAITVGQPVGAFLGAYYPRDAQGNIVRTGRLDASCQPIAGTEGLIVSRARGPNCQILRKFLGSPEPKFTLTWNNEVDLGRRWQVGMLLDGRFGNKVANFSRRISEYFGAAASTGGEQCVTANATVYCQQTLNTERHLLYEEFVEDGSFVKLREASLRYTMDQRWVKRMGVESATLSVAGRNLHTWTDYTGIDPEVNLFSANTVARGVEFGTSPIPRTWAFGVTVNF